MTDAQKKFHQWALNNLPVRTIVRETTQDWGGSSMSHAQATRIQFEIVKLEKQGLKVREIAEILNIGQTTVRNHSRKAKENGIRR